MTERATANPPVKKPGYGSSRVASIDSARGAAMLFVCLAHFANAYQFVSGADASGMYLVLIGMVASPTFVIVSGFVAGFLSITRSSTFGQLRQKLIDRGFFLLIVGHTILAISHVFAGAGFVAGFKIGYVTDVVGFAVVLGPWLVDSVRPKPRVLLALGVFVLSWLAVFQWHPTGFGATAKQYLIGIPNLSDATRGDFPLLPWFAVYLLGTVLGQTLGRYYAENRHQAGHLVLASIGAVSFAAGTVAKLALHLFRSAAPAFEQAHPLLVFSVSTYQKFPPGPVYVIFFGGAGMVMVAAILEAGRRGMMPFLLGRLRQIGLASLFIYVLQYYVYVVVLRALRLPYSPFWPLLFLFTIFLLERAAAVWNSAEGNRYLTVGLAALLRWIKRRRELALTKQIALDAPFRKPVSTL
ncbi:MAG TPA: heparan-alpha-glucosaminide N-acetyltransferase domain-containing protein [Gemmatimonadaceae bacterium]|jgi:uncharacterized membrane protein|nr:heparan-alpha-glucosaminide N-acetyltransferase domain-containing protein [Gemmatimonadaceae bacterium]